MNPFIKGVAGFAIGAVIYAYVKQRIWYREYQRVVETVIGTVK